MASVESPEELRRVFPAEACRGQMVSALRYALLSVLLLLFTGSAGHPGQLDRASSGKSESEVEQQAAVAVPEARGRARILHETVHGALQVMHRDFFRDDEGLKIPSQSLEDVFAELKRSFGVEMHWLAVDTQAMNVDNEPRGELQVQAANALKEGRTEFEAVVDGRFHYAGRIRLSATCLSCHLSRRSSNDDRFAGLLISMPLQDAARTPAPESQN